jgi:hypothetical protein
VIPKWSEINFLSNPETFKTGFKHAHLEEKTQTMATKKKKIKDFHTILHLNSLPGKLFTYPPSSRR